MKLHWDWPNVNSTIHQYPYWHACMYPELVGTCYYRCFFYANMNTSTVIHHVVSVVQA